MKSVAFLRKRDAENKCFNWKATSGAHVIFAASAISRICYRSWTFSWRYCFERGAFLHAHFLLAIKQNNLNRNRSLLILQALNPYGLFVFYDIMVIIRKVLFNRLLLVQRESSSFAYWSFIFHYKILKFL